MSLMRIFPPAIGNISSALTCCARLLRVFNIFLLPNAGNVFGAKAKKMPFFFPQISELLSISLLLWCLSFGGTDFFWMEDAVVAKRYLHS